MRQAGFLHTLPAAMAAMAALAALAALATQARADGLRFSLGYNYSLADTETRTASGETGESHSSAFGQQYRIDFDRRLYPSLSLRGGGLFERSDSEFEVDSTTSEASSTRTSPYVNLLLTGPLHNGGLGFSRVEDRSESNGVKQTPLIRDTYNASFGLRPVDLPTLNLQYTRNDTYDQDRLRQDDTGQRFVFGSSYQVSGQLGLSYQGNYSTTDDEINRLHTEDLSHSARIDYNERFWNDRVSLLGSYTYGQRNSKVVAEGSGEVETFVNPQAGLFALDNDPELGELTATLALTDGPDANDPDAIPPPSNLPVTDLVSAGGELRNLGLELPVDPFEAEFPSVNTLRVYARKENGEAFSSNSQLDVNQIGMARSNLNWDVYISADGNLWDVFAENLTAAFDFDSPDSFFEIRFPAVRTRFIKLVVAPLDPVPGVIPDAILVTELLPLLIQPAADVEGSRSSSSHQVTINVRTRLLDAPSLYHNFSAYYTNVQPTAVSRTFISNSLSLLHRLSPKLSLTAQVGRDDTDEARGKTVIHRWGASLLATPIPALRQNLTYSGQIADDVGETSVRNSLFLNNRATLYRGVDLVLNGGVSTGSGSGEDTTNYLVNLGATVIPHSSMTWDLSFGANRSERSGGGEADSTSTDTRWRASVAYNPAPALGLFLAMERVKQPEQTRTLRNYSVNWSPFSGGALQFNLGYNETLREESDTVERSFSPNVSWEIRRGTFLSVSYALSESESPLQETTSRVFGASLRATF